MKPRLEESWKSLCEASDNKEDILRLVINELHQPFAHGRLLAAEVYDDFIHEIMILMSGVQGI